MTKSKSTSRRSGKKRASVTDGMKTVQDKLMSAVDRKKVRFDDRGGFWVCVPGEKGHPSYIYNIKDRLKADRFEWDSAGCYWRKSKAVAPERAIGLSDAEKERCARNRAKALEIRAARSA